MRVAVRRKCFQLTSKVAVYTRGSRLRPITSCFTRTVGRVDNMALGRISASKGGTSVHLGVDGGLSPRTCQLAISTSNMDMRTKKPTNTFCTLRSIQLTVRPRSGAKVPQVRITSQPQFNCHKLVISISECFVRGRRLVGVVSYVSILGLGGLRLRLASSGK